MPDGSPGIAVCDDSGDTPDQCDDKVMWLDTENVVLLEAEGYDSYGESRKNLFRYCHVENLMGFRDDGSAIKIGGTSGVEVLKLVEHFNIKAAVVEYNGRTTRIKPVEGIRHVGVAQ